VKESVHRLLSGEDGTIASHLQPFADALIAANPVTVRGWLNNSRSVGLLAEFVAEQTPITHEALDRFLPAAHINHVRGLLVTTGVLPRRNEALARLELWVARHVPTLPSHQQNPIRPYAEWHIVRRARRQAARSTYSDCASQDGRHRIRSAIKFLNWLDETGTALTDLSQHHVDTYLANVINGLNPQPVLLFLEWLKRRRLATGIEIARRKHGLPQRLQEQEDYQRQLSLCLHDQSLPLDTRIAGALVRLYALPLVRIVELTTDRFYRDAGHAYLVIDKNPVALPPALAELIEERIRKGSSGSMVRTVSPGQPVYLLPGRPPSQPRNARSLANLLTAQGLPTIAARNTATMANIADLNPTVVSDLFGTHRTTAHTWARFAQTSWTAYLAAADPTGPDIANAP
jgi:hypothetical protein